MSSMVFGPILSPVLLVSENVGLRVSECTTPFVALGQGSVPTTLVDRAMS